MARPSPAGVTGNINTLARHILSFCDENVQDIPEGRFLVAILAQAFADLAKDDWLAKRWIASKDCEGLCEAIGLSHLSVLAWRGKYESAGQQNRAAAD